MRVLTIINELGWSGDDVGEPPPILPHRHPSLEDTQGVVNIENEFMEVSREGEPLQLLPVQLEPYHYDPPPLPPPQGDPEPPQGDLDQPFPAEESEEGSSNPSQIAPPCAP